MKSTEYSVVFPLRKIFKNLILALPAKYFPVLLCNTYDKLKLHEVAFLPVGQFRFYNAFTENTKFPYLVVQIEVQIAKNMQGTKNTTFCSLMTISHRKEITRLKYYRTNSTDSRSKNIKSAKPLKIQWFCWCSYHQIIEIMSINVDSK